MKGPAFDGMMGGAFVIIVWALGLATRARRRFDDALVPLPRNEVASLVRKVEPRKPVAFINAEREGWF